MEERQLGAEFHRALVHDCDLVSATIGEDPRGRCAMAPHPAEIREVDPLSLECLPVVAGEVLTDKARERRRNAESGRDAGDVPAGPTEHLLAAHDLNRRVRWGKAFEGDDLVQDHMAVNA